MSSSDFSQNVDKIINCGWVAAGLSMGSRLGLFDGLAKMAISEDQAVTSVQLADSMNMKERYIREWIGGMVCGDIIDHCEVDGTDRYWLAAHKLPALIGAEKADTLTRSACNAQGAELLVGALGDYRAVEQCFYKDGPPGTPVDNYPILHEFLARRDSLFKTMEHVRAFIGDGVLMKKLESGISVLELGCGAAAPTKLLAENFPLSTFVASDLSATQIKRAEQSIKGLANVTFCTLDACDVADDLANKFDLVMLFDVFHDVSYPDQLIQGVLKLLKTGGQFLMLDINMLGNLKENRAHDSKRSAFYYIVSSLYCVPTSLYQPGGFGLGACAGAPLMRKMLKDGGFKQVNNVVNDYGLCFLCTKE